MRLRNVALSFVLVGSVIPFRGTGLAGGVPNAAYVDPKGAVWSFAGTDWTPVTDVPDARVAAVFQGELVFANAAGEVFRRSGSGAPHKIPGIAEVRALSCGPNHCMALTSRGVVFEWSQKGGRPQRIDGVQDAIAIAAGTGHSLAATEMGEVVVWGTDGLGPRAARVPTEPAIVAGLSGAVSVAAGDGTSFALLEGGDVIAWGMNNVGQLGLPASPAPRPPTRIEGVKANSIAATGARAWASTPLGGLFEVSRGVLDLSPDHDVLGVIPTPDGAMVLEEDGAVVLLGGGEQRFPASTFRRGLDRSPDGALPTESIRGAGAASLVIGTTAPSASDAALGERLENLGFLVQYVQDRVADETSLASQSLVLIAPSARGRLLSDVVSELGAPILALDPFSAMKLGMVEESAIGRGWSGADEAVIVRGEHALGGGGAGAYFVTNRPTWLPWARTVGSDVVAVAPSGYGSVFVYETGAALPAGVAHAPRGAVLLGGDAQQYSPSGWAILDEAVRWALGAPPGSGLTSIPATGGGGPQVFSLTGGSGTILLVVGNLTLSAGDASYKSRMEAMGFTVQTKLASASSASDATGKKLVFVSSSSPNGDILAKFLNVTVPVLIQTSGIVDDMKMSNAKLPKGR